MATERSYNAENNAARARMKALIERLSDEELARPIDAGWTIAGVLAHIAFWDERTIVLMDRWASGIAPSQADFQPPDIDWINDASKPFCVALPVRVAAQLALDTAAKADGRIAALSDEMLAKIVAAGTPFNLLRAKHRTTHLDDFERYL